MKVFTQITPPPAESEKLDTQDLGVLDKESLTSVVDFIQKFQKDASFAPPTRDVMFDSERYNLDIDKDGDYPERYPDIESLGYESTEQNKDV